MLVVIRLREVYIIIVLFICQCSHGTSGPSNPKDLLNKGLEKSDHVVSFYNKNQQSPFAGPNAGRTYGMAGMRTTIQR